MKSHRACLTCRSRKLKCDETKPICGQCRKSRRTCQDSTAFMFRHDHNASIHLLSERTNPEPSVKPKHRPKNRFHEDHVWLHVPSQVEFLDCSPGSLKVQTTSPVSVPAESLHAEITDPVSIDFTDGADVISPLSEVSVLPTLHSSEMESNSPVLEPHGTQDPSNERLSLGEYDTSISSFESQGRPVAVTEGSITNDVGNMRFQENQSPPEAPPSSSCEETRVSSPSFSTLIIPNTQRTVYNTACRPDSALTSTSVNIQGHNLNPDFEHFLIRRFSEVCGKWIDLFDSDSYFATCVSIKAFSTPLLKCAAIALTAKQLSLVRLNKTVYSENLLTTSFELYAEFNSTQWQYYATDYYNKAISLLKGYLEDHDGISNGRFPQSNEAPWSLSGRQEGCLRPVDVTSVSNSFSDDVLATVAILSVYEFLDASGFAWAGHLNGIRSLLDVDGIMQPDMFPEGSQPISSLTVSRKATFWNFARQDVVAAYMNNCHTRLDTEDYQIWRAAGLSINKEGFIEQNLKTRPDIASNGLIWLLSRIVNYLAAGEEIDPGQRESLCRRDSGLGVNQRTLLKRWKRLVQELDLWFSTLPDVFQMCTRVASLPDHITARMTWQTNIPLIWYSISMCASCMQSYHLARILLLINKPHLLTAYRGTMFDRVNSYRDITKDLEYHSREICGIALSRPDEATRIHMIQPLFTAGQCLPEEGDRKIVLHFLREIESELGWSTQFHVKQLLECWGWNERSQAPA